MILSGIYRIGRFSSALLGLSRFWMDASTTDRPLAPVGVRGGIILNKKESPHRICPCGGSRLFDGSS